MISIRNSFFIVLAILYFANCNKSTLDQKTNPPVESNIDQSFSYLALGDSYTIGEGVAENMRWPNQLSKALFDDKIKVSPVRIIAKTGWTTRNLIDAIAKEKPQKHDMVSLLIGVNNQYQGKPFDQFEKELKELLNIAISLSNDPNKVFVVSIPDYGVTPYGANKRETIAEELNRYNAFTAELCANLHIPYVNITPISRDLGSNDNALAADKLHPSGYQYSKWVEAILPVAKKMLQ